MLAVFTKFLLFSCLISMQTTISIQTIYLEQYILRFWEVICFPKTKCVHNVNAKDIFILELFSHILLSFVFFKILKWNSKNFCRYFQIKTLWLFVLANNLHFSDCFSSFLILTNLLLSFFPFNGLCCTFPAIVVKDRINRFYRNFSWNVLGYLFPPIVFFCVFS